MLSQSKTEMQKKKIKPCFVLFPFALLLFLTPHSLGNSSAKGAGMGSVRISIIDVRKITSVFINRHRAKCEPTYHPMWAA